MKNPVDAILFDVGGTLRRSTKRSEAARLEYIQKILDRLEIDSPALDFMRLLTDRHKAYRRWAKQHLVELDEARLWTEWLLPDQPVGKVAPIAVELNQLWRDSIAERWMIHDARQTILDLFRSGYRLGLVSNTTSSIEVPATLAKEGIEGCFETIILSCVVGKRKPGAEILLEAAGRIGVRPERCAYVGNRPDRDVAAARRAGFARTVILCDPNKPFKNPVTPDLEPDHYINNLTELLDIFPSRGGAPAQTGPVYDISFSTMWGLKKFGQLEDFFRAAPRLGFTGVELNHQVSPAMLAGLDLKRYAVRSIHEPCPAAISADALKKGDLLISSPDEERRRQGVKSIQASIDLARELGVDCIVIHSGMVQTDTGPEKRLTALFDAGQAGSPEYLETKAGMMATRGREIEPYLAAVQKSLRELLEYAGRAGVRLGLENRYHYFDIPSPDEMALLLELAGPDRLGVIFDSGHAWALHSLGFYPFEEWLERFSSRILGVHLHDALGFHDHRVPGEGEIDFDIIAASLPAPAFRTLEIQAHHSVEQVKSGLKILADAGCIRLL